MGKVTLFTDRSKCCGCEACSYACPARIIEMSRDGEGFLYPRIIDASKCIDCKKCEKVCPVANAGSEKHPFTAYKAGSMTDSRETVQCASGGLATALSRAVVAQGGVVYGVSYGEDFRTIGFARAACAEELLPFRGSKYAQAGKEGIYALIEKDLKDGKTVLFIGLPCEVYAVKLLFAKYEDLLYTAELICHGPTSPEVHRQFCEMLEKRENSKIRAFSVRYKKDGKWKPYYVRAAFENGSIYEKPFHDTEYGIAFRFLKRPSCNQCSLKAPYLYADLMLGDYHYAHKGVKGYDPAGVSVALVHNEKGERLLAMLKEDFSICDASERGALMNKAIGKAIPARAGRRSFVKHMKKKGLADACRAPFVVMTDGAVKAKNRVVIKCVKIAKKVLRMGK